MSNLHYHFLKRVILVWQWFQAIPGYQYKNLLKSNPFHCKPDRLDRKTRQNKIFLQEEFYKQEKIHANDSIETYSW